MKSNQNKKKSMAIISYLSCRSPLGVRHGRKSSRNKWCMSDYSDFDDFDCSFTKSSAISFCWASTLSGM